MKRQLVGLIVLLTFFAGLITIICVNSKYIFRSEPYYSQTEVDKMCNDSYNKAVDENSDEVLLDTISKLNKLYSDLELKNEQLLSVNETLKSEIAEKGKTIVDNEETIENLNLRISELEENKSANEILIADLQVQIDYLNSQNQLLSNEISKKEDLIEENNKTITQLQNSITYYEEYIESLESETEVFAIFMVENEVYNIQKLNKGGIAYLETNPSDTDTYKFNGWTVNGESVDLTSYFLSCNTTFVADLAYSYGGTYSESDVYISDEIFISRISEKINNNESIFINISANFGNSKYICPLSMNFSGSDNSTSYSFTYPGPLNTSKTCIVSCNISFNEVQGLHVSVSSSSGPVFSSLYVKLYI